MADLWFRTDHSLVARAAVLTKDKWTQMDTFRFYAEEAGRPQSTHPIIYMSVFPSPTFSPSKEVMSSGGVAEPTFQVMMCTLSEEAIM